MAAISTFFQGFNYVFALALASVITVYAVKYNVYKDFSPDYTLMLTIVGYVSTANSILGDLVDYAFRDNGALKALKFLVTLILILGIIGTSIAVIVIIPQKLPWNMLTQVMSYKLNVTDLRVWDHVHQDFKCCGILNYTDWVDQGELQNNSLPDSCCKNFTASCGDGVVDTIYDLDNATVYTQGCTQAGFFDFFYPWTFAISGATIAANVINLIYFCVSCGDGDGVTVDAIG